jgi:hypothetical protein
MNVHQDYTQLTLPHLAIHNYREEAEQKAIAFFVSLAGEQKEAFFAFFKELHTKNKGIYQDLHLNFEAMQQNTQKITKNHLRHILAVLPKFLPTDQAIELFAYEIQDHIQKHKLALTRHFTLKPAIREVFELFSKFQASLSHLTSHPSSWFHRLAYQDAERRETVEAVVYVAKMRLQNSLQNFVKDVQTILQQIAKLNHHIEYFVAFLGVEVKIGKNDSAPKEMAIPPLALPVFQTAFAPNLYEYLAYQSQDIAVDDSLQTMNKSLLAHDLEVALKHYQNNNALTNIVEISFALKGGAGVAKLNIKSWLARLVALDFTRQEMFVSSFLFVVLAQYFTEEFSWFKLIGYAFYPLLFFSFLYYVNRFVRKEEDENEQEHTYERERSYRQEMFVQQYEQLLRDKKAEKKIVRITENVPDQIEVYILHLLEKETAFTTGHYPNFIVALYQKQMQCLYALRVEDIPQLESFEGSEDDRKELLEAVRHVLWLKTKKSFMSFGTMVHYLLQYKTTAKYYVHLFGKECAILQSFYETNVQKKQDENYFQQYQNEVKSTKERFDSWETLPTFAGRYAEVLQTWVQQEMDSIAQSTLTKEVAQLKEYLAMTQRNLNTPYKVLPLILEGEEGILYI